jgi:adenosylcobinamide-phosphate synthase
MTAQGSQRSALPAVAAPAIGLLLDRLLGEPPTSVHPVARFGQLMGAVEQRAYADDRIAGLAYGVTGIAVTAAVAGLLRRSVGRSGATVVAVAVCSAARMLERECRVVDAQLDRGDLAGARARVRSLVGRDVDELDASQIRRAVLESLAENTADAVTATLWWGAVGGAPAALLHRAVNTMDAMVGHRSARYGRFGSFSARADDVANWLPARATALAIVAVSPARARDVWRAIADDAPAHPSPNAGVVEAAFAGALGLQLGGTTVYGGRVESRPRLGSGRPVRAGDLERAIRLERRATVALAIALAAGRAALRRRVAPRSAPAARGA